MADPRRLPGNRPFSWRTVAVALPLADSLNDRAPRWAISRPSQ
jgi:hypothetical protein